MTQLNNSVSRAFAILNLFDENTPELTAGQVAGALDLNPVTAHRFLKSLESVGAVVAVTRGSFRLGRLFADLGNRVVHHRYIADAAQPSLARVTETVKESSMAAIFEAGMTSCIVSIPSGRTLLVNVRVGTRMEAYCTALGKLWLAHLDDPSLEDYLSKVAFVPFTAHTIRTVGNLRAELDTIRTQGYAVNDSEREDFIRAIGVPVYDRAGRMLTGISVFGPTSRMTDEVMQASHRELDKAARDITERLYGRPLTATR